MSVDIKDFGDTDKKLVSKLSKRGAFDPCLERHVDMARVNVDVMGRWVGERLTELLGFEDEVVIGLVKNLLSVRADALTGQAKRVDPKALQVQLTGFLEKQAAPFVAELWQLLLKAQDAPYGIPPAFVEKKKEQLRAQKSDQREATQRRIVAEASRHGRRAEEPVAASVDEGSGERARERSNKRTRFSSPTKRRREDDDDRSTMERRRRGLWERRESRSQPGQWYYYNTRTKQTR